MRRLVIFVLTAFALGTPAFGLEATAQKVVLPQDLVWRPAPPSFPPGSESVVLYGDPAKEGPFIVRVRAPKGFRLPLHTHPVPEVLTVLSGVVSFSVGPDAKSSRVPAGGFSVMPPGIEHMVVIEDDAVVQINAIGPWRIDYVDPKDDPRTKAR